MTRSPIGAAPDSLSVSQDEPSPSTTKTTIGEAEGSGAKGLGYNAEQRILEYLRDGDVDKHSSLQSDVQRLYQEMLTWRIACQRWTPGGSEYMDPAFCVQFIEHERRASHLNKIELAQLRAAARRDVVAGALKGLWLAAACGTDEGRVAALSAAGDLLARIGALGPSAADPEPAPLPIQMETPHD